MRSFSLSMTPLRLGAIFFLPLLAFFSCVHGRPGGPCSQPMETGPCRMSFPAYFYNSQTNRCESFYYGGCRGNKNRFGSLRDCQRECHPSTDSASLNPSVKSEHCKSPPESGPMLCAGSFRKFTFHYDTLSCEPHVYGGCGATANLYDNIQECMGSCIHGVIGSQPAAPSMKSMFRSVVPKASSISPSGVATNRGAILFPKWSENEEGVCDLPPVNKGPIACTALIPKWTYDKRRGKCVNFIYGGCGATANNFDTKEDCEATCPKTPKKIVQPPPFVRPDFCSLPAVVSEGGIQCLALRYGYTFNEAKGTCEQIMYGGCGATANFFHSLQKCQTVCQGHKEEPQKLIDVCAQPTYVGKCRGRKPKYTFNGETQRCEKFFYSGCEGNGNRFDSIEECFDTCGGGDPEENAVCSRVKCDKPDIDFHTAKACKPITKKGECCPSSWDCSFWENERLKRLDECFHVSPNFPHGKFYKIKEQIKDDGEGLCIGGAFCGKGDDGLARVIASVGMCGRPAFSPQDDCIQQYNSTMECCSKRHKCGAEKKRLHTCSFEGKRYHEGEKMYSDQNPCLTCLCTSDFDEAHQDYFCTETKCRYLTDSDKLIQNCVPVNRPDSCCPIDWICPIPISQIPKLDVSPLGPDNIFQVSISPPFFFPGSVKTLAAPKQNCPPGVEINPHYEAKTVSVSPETLSLIASPFSSSSETHNALPIATEGKSPDDCILPPAEGPCQGFRDKFFFNIDNRKCTPFKYGGFDEDAPGFNVFKSKEECEKVCEKLLPSLPKAPPVLAKQRTLECVNPASPGITPGHLCLPLARRYRYNSSKDKCEPFTTGLCKPGPNQFATQQECDLKCVQSPIRIDLSTNNVSEKTGICQLSALAGNCRSRIKRYYYSPAHGRCRLFYYSGCQGNANNFLTEEECERICVSDNEVRSSFSAPQRVGLSSDFVEEIKNPCDQPKNTGRCKAMKPSYYFDKREGVCKFFIYGGCMGNANRFSSLKECSQTCEVSLEKQTEGNHCKKSPDPGRCFAIIRKWYYDPESRTCKLFFYGGCGGNGNNFDTKEECELSCSSDIDVPQGRIRDKNIQTQVVDDSILSNGLVDPCLMEKKIGDCRSALRKFYFDKETKECRLFHYGGCNGNDNNFPSKEICSQVCARHFVTPKTNNDPPASIQTKKGDEVPFSPQCLSPVDAGVCRASKTRFHFNADTGRCEKFIYGGCQGNENNFKTEEECYALCLPLFVDSNPELKEKVEAKIHEQEFCRFGNKTFSLGDSLKLNEDSCTSCTCSSPPNLSCHIKKCAMELTPVNTEGCRPKFDDDGCCQIGYDCQKVLKPCAERSCLSKKFIEPEGMTCKKIKDSDDCCVLSIICVPKENLTRDFSLGN